MDDPAKVVVQIRNYVTDGRMEISEVMAEELSAMLLADRNRDLAKQSILVDVLRLHTTILSSRNKWKPSLAAAKRLETEWASLSRLSAKQGVQVSDEHARIRIEDLLHRGRVLTELGKLKKALRAYSMPAKMGHIEAHLLSLEAFEKCKGTLKKANKQAKSLVQAMKKIGPVSRLGGEFLLVSDDGLATSVERITECAGRWLQPELGLNSKTAESLSQSVNEVIRQRDQIEAGERAADARLQSAIDALSAPVDYYEYSKGGSG